MSREIKVAAVHAAPEYMNVEATVTKACSLIEQAGANDIDLVVFPEVFLPGFPYWINCYPPLIQAGVTRHYQDLSIEIPGPEVEALQAAGEAAGVVVVIGVSERETGGRTCFNSSVILDADGTLLGVHRKLQPTFAERTVWGQGDGSTLFVLDTAVGRVGALACWEHTMNLARQALISQNLEIHAALWPGLSTLAGFTDTADLQIEAMMRNHAITGQCFVICASSPVTDTMIDFMNSELGEQSFMTAGGGYSEIIHPFCLTLAGPHRGPEETMVIADIDLDQIHDTKVFVDSNGHYARPEILQLLFDDEPKPPVIRATDFDNETLED